MTSTFLVFHQSQWNKPGTSKIANRYHLPVPYTLCCSLPQYKAGMKCCSNTGYLHSFPLGANTQNVRQWQFTFAYPNWGPLPTWPTGCKAKVLILLALLTEGNWARFGCRVMEVREIPGVEIWKGFILNKYLCTKPIVLHSSAV